MILENTKEKFTVIENDMNELFMNIQNTEKVMSEILKATGVITDNISQVSANSEEVAATSQECVDVSKKAVDDIGKVNNEMTSIYMLSARLKQD